MESALIKDAAALSRLQIALLRNNGAAYFPERPLSEILELHFILLHMIVNVSEGRASTVSYLARAMGLSRASVRSRLRELVDAGYAVRNGNGHILTEPRDPGFLRQVLVRKAKIVAETCKQVSELAAMEDFAMAEIAS